jgi:predicted enzyme related to lactoylglutathione lyase
MLSQSKAFFSVSVDDLETARNFYTNTLGLNAKQIPEGVEIELHGGGSLFLYPKQNHEPATFTVLNFLVDDIDRAAADLQARGITFEHYDLPDLKTDEKGIARGTPSNAWFKDPAGNILAIVKP